MAKLSKPRLRRHQAAMDVRACYFSWEAWMTGYFVRVPNVMEMVMKRIVTTIERKDLPLREKMRLRTEERYSI